jgi:hypothetical protein
MKKFKVLMRETVTYSLVVEIEVGESIEQAAEEQFVQGDYVVVGQGDRRVVDFEEVTT